MAVEKQETFPGQGLRKLRVRIPKYYHANFVIDLGQRNAEMVKRPMLSKWRHRHIKWADPGAFTFATGGGCDLMHTSNAVPLLTRLPYIITFENYCPYVPDDTRVEWLLKFLRRRLLSPRCRAIIAYSQFGMRQFRQQNRGYRRLAELEAKMRVIYPGVRLRRQDPKRSSGRLRLLFVSNRFISKGGPALVRAHERIRDQGIPIETTIVSKLQWSVNDFIDPGTGYDVEGEHRRVQQAGITWYRGLPNGQVMKLMAEADFFIFPTFFDTFGVAPVEALSCGTPVIATNTGVQPEIVEDGVCGHLLPFENDPVVGRWKHLYQTAAPDYHDIFARTIDMLANSLTQQLISCWESCSDYERLSAAAIDRVRDRFNRDRVRDELEQLYESCRR